MIQLTIVGTLVTAALLAIYAIYVGVALVVLSCIASWFTYSHFQAARKSARA